MVNFPLMSKHQEYFQQMLNLNRDAFEKFRKLHDQYVSDPKKYQEQFNLEGEEILSIIREWENKLCNETEGGGFGKFSANLADKFWEQVRFNFPKIDYVGLLD